MANAADQIRSYQRKEYLSRFIEGDVRPDNRSLGQTRPALMSLGSITTADGSAMVKLGNTVVVCGIKAEITRPPAEHQNHGVFIPNVQLPPMCSPTFKSGAPSDEAQVLSSYINEVISNSRVFDLNQLCIHAGEYCWILYCDAVCCNYDGNIKDAALMAVVGALKDCKLPKATYNTDEEQLSIDNNTKIPLVLSNIAVPLTFTIFDDKILLVDPTHEEETVSHGEITVIATSPDNVTHISKQGGTSLSLEQLNVCMSSAKKRWSEINNLLDKNSIKS